MRNWCMGCLLIAMTVWGCRQKTPETVMEPGFNLSEPSRAQPRLPTVKLWLGSEELQTEIASTPVQTQTGMMFRQEMAENEGMLFIFRHPQQVSFYMKNTTVPLSCAYIDREGAILEIHDLQPLELTPVYSDSDQVQFVLETRQGWFRRHQIGVGTLVRTERGSLRETFIR